MHRGILHVLAWSLATGAAIALAWWGVHSVMEGTAYDPPRALPVTGPPVAAPSAQAPGPSPSRTSGPPVSRPPAAASSSSSSSAPSPSAATATPAAAAPSGTTGADSGQVRSYATKGGHVVFDLGASSATLVSATPASGWAMQVWKQTTWIRIEFRSGADRVSVFCTWHDHPPQVDVETY